MTDTTFDGFVPPTKNYFQMPNNWIDICAQITNLSELKVVQYVLRHTWGFHEYGKPKAISVDEFMNGRRRDDGSRMDKGTGLSNHSVIDGLKAAIKHGFLICEVDTSDLARIKKSYSLKMASPSEDSSPHENNAEGEESTPQGCNIFTPAVKNLHPSSEESSHRSEKDTLERHLKKNTLEKKEEASASALTPAQAKQQSFAYSQNLKDQTQVVESTDYMQESKPVDPPAKPNKRTSRQRKPKVEQPVLVDTSKKTVAFNEAEQQQFDWYCGCDFIRVKPEQNAGKKQHCATLIPHVHSQEDMQSLANFTKAKLEKRGIKVYVVEMGNMTNSSILNEWLASQPKNVIQFPGQPVNQYSIQYQLARQAARQAQEAIN